jgi:hypothetical protein
MHLQAFKILQRTRLDLELSTLFRTWNPNPEQRAEFVRWAWLVAEGADVSASRNRDLAAELLRKQRAETHALIAERLHHTSTVDLELVSKRTFLVWLESELLGGRAAA